MKIRLTILLLVGLVPAPPSWSADFTSLCADRAAIERVYYNHRLGEKPPFEQVLPRASVENLVQHDLRKEAALKQTFNVEITPTLLDAEVQRIKTTTRAPEMLAEIKAALGNDPARFADAFAKPILVERLLREKFDNDDVLHAPQRREMEQVRERILQARSSQGNEAPSSKSEIESQKSEIDESLLTSAATNGFVGQLVAILKNSPAGSCNETVWQLGAHPAETNASAADEIEIKKRFGPNAQIVSSACAAGKDTKFYFEDLPGELQNVLRVQLRQPGDVSAVIEMPGGFLLYVCKMKTDETLSVVGLSVPKRSYEQWLAELNK